MSAAQAQVAALETRIQSLEKELEAQSAAQRQLRADAARRSRLTRAGFANPRAQGADATSSMLRGTTHHQENTPQLIKEMKQGHPWLNIVDPAGVAKGISSLPDSSDEFHRLKGMRNPEIFLDQKSK